MPGMFDEFIKKEDPKKKIDEIAQIAKQEAAPGLFDEFIQKPAEKEPLSSSGLFDEFTQNKSVQPTGMFDDLIKKDAKKSGNNIVSDLIDIVKDSAIADS